MEVVKNIFIVFVHSYFYFRVVFYTVLSQFILLFYLVLVSLNITINIF